MVVSQGVHHEVFKEVDKGFARSAPNQGALTIRAA